MNDVTTALTEPAQALLHLAALLLVAAMLVTSMRRLRMLALGAGIAALLHLALSGGGGFALSWVAAFVLANGLRLTVLLLRSRTGDLRREERQLLEHVLRVEEPARQRRLLGLLAWRNVPAGEVLMRQGQASPPLVYIAHGSALVEHEGKLVGSCGPGDFLGEMSLVTGERATATVVAGQEMRVAVLDRDALAQLARSAPEIGHAIDAVINRSLVAKVVRMNRAAAGSEETLDEGN